MLHKTRGIVLNYIKYRDTSIIARIYTREFGKQSYIINGIRSNKSKKSIGCFQPLTLLDLVVYKNKNKDIQRLSEFKITYPFKTITFEIKKNAIAIFLTEIFSKVLEEHHVEDSSQFDFLYHSIEVLDEFENGFENFHIYIMIKLSLYLGFGIVDSDLLVSDGDKDVINFLDQLNQSSGFPTIEVNRDIRKKALENLISYYESNMSTFRNIKSLEIMHQIFD